MSGTVSDSAGAALYSQLKPPGSPFQSLQNTLGMASQLGQAQNALIGAQSNAMQFRARQAMGPILQSAIGPDGQLDYNKALVGMAANPNTAWMAPDFLNQAVARQQTQADTANKQLENARNQFGAYNGALGALATLGTGVTRGDVIGKLSELVGNGMLSKENALKYAAGLPPDGAPLFQYVRQHQLQAQTAKDSLDAVYGQLQTNNVGNKNIISQASPFMGTNNPLAGGTMIMGHTPEQADALKTVVGPGGQPGVMPRAALGGMVAPVGGQSNSPNAQPRLGDLPSPAGSGVVRATGAAVGSGGGATISPTNVPAPAGAPAGFIPTGLPLSTEAFLKGTGPAADAFKELNANVTAGQAALPGVREMQGVANMISTGSGTPTKLAVAQAFTALGAPQSAINAVMGTTEGDPVAAAQVFNKFAPQLALGALKSTLGDSAPKVLEFENYLKQFPNLGTQPKAIQALLHYTAGMIEVKQKEQQIFSQYMKEPDFDPNQWPAKWTSLLNKWKAYNDLDKEGTAILSGKFNK